jgi:hypothetical protein
MTDVDAKSQPSKKTHEQGVRRPREREKKKKYPEAFLKQRRDFYPFMESTGGLLGKES